MGKLPRASLDESSGFFSQGFKDSFPGVAVLAGAMRGEKGRAGMGWFVRSRLVRSVDRLRTGPLGHFSLPSLGESRTSSQLPTCAWAISCCGAPSPATSATRGQSCIAQKQPSAIVGDDKVITVQSAQHSTVGTVSSYRN
jgi:hypothetical protein